MTRAWAVRTGGSRGSQRGFRQRAARARRRVRARAAPPDLASARSERLPGRLGGCSGGLGQVEAPRSRRRGVARPGRLVRHSGPRPADRARPRRLALGRLGPGVRPDRGTAARRAGSARRGGRAGPGHDRRGRRRPSAGGERRGAGPRRSGRPPAGPHPIAHGEPGRPRPSTCPGCGSPANWWRSGRTTSVFGPGRWRSSSGTCTASR